MFPDCFGGSNGNSSLVTFIVLLRSSNLSLFFPLEDEEATGLVIRLVHVAG